MEKYRKQ